MWIYYLARSCKSMVDREQIASHIQDWQKLILLNSLDQARSSFSSRCHYPDSALNKYYEHLLTILIYKLDKECLIDVYFDVVRTESEQLIRLWREGLKKIDVDGNTYVSKAVFKVDALLTLQFRFRPTKLPLSRGFKQVLTRFRNMIIWLQQRRLISRG